MACHPSKRFSFRNPLAIAILAVRVAASKRIAAGPTRNFSLDIARQELIASLDPVDGQVRFEETPRTEDNMETIRKAIVIAFAAVFSFTPVMSNDIDTKPPTSEEDRLRATAERVLKQTYSNFKFHSFSKSPIPGLYQIDTGSRMIYLHAETENLIFGDIYNNEGQNLTQQALDAATSERMKDFDYSAALVLGPEEAPILTEFSNPFCGHCQNLHRWLDSGEMKDIPVRRQIIFAVGHSRQAQDAAEHIFCSEDKEAAFSEIYEKRAPRRLRRCEEGYDLVQKHIELAEAAGVTGTPTLFADGERIRGFDQRKIGDFLKQQTKGE